MARPFARLWGPAFVVVLLLAGTSCGGGSDDEDDAAFCARAAEFVVASADLKAVVLKDESDIPQAKATALAFIASLKATIEAAPSQFDDDMEPILSAIDSVEKRVREAEDLSDLTVELPNVAKVLYEELNPNNSATEPLFEYAREHCPELAD